MSFNWSHYLDVARDLVEQAKDAPPALQEARSRASISRAYYAVFGKAHDHLRYTDKVALPNPLIDADGKRISIHQYVRDTFKGRQNKDCILIGQALERMAKDRNIADYDTYNVLSKNLLKCAQYNLIWAKMALTCLDHLSNK